MVLTHAVDPVGEAGGTMLRQGEVDDEQDNPDGTKGAGAHGPGQLQLHE